MKKHTVIRLAVFVLLVLTVAALWPLRPAQAESPVRFLTNRDLVQLGVERPENFWPIQLSRDGRTLIAAENLQGKATHAGALSRVWVLRFNSDGSVKESRNFPLQMPRRLQNTLTPDEKGLVLLAREGASFWHLDLQSGALREFIHAGLGVTRFVSDPNVLWSSNGKLYAVGFPVDENGVRGKQTVVTIDPSKTDAEAIQPSGLDIGSVYEHFDKPVNVRWISPEAGYLGGMIRNDYKMTLWKKDGGFRDLATLDSVQSMLGMGPYLALAGLAKGGGSVAYLFDAETGAKWTAPPIRSGMEYNYPFVSAGGETLVLTEGRKGGQTVSLLYGRKEAGYTLRPLEGLQNKKSGVIRLSADGSHLVYRNADGIYYAEIPK